jgi:uncharacterized protein (UPF0335 family)
MTEAPKRRGRKAKQEVETTVDQEVDTVEEGLEFGGYPAPKDHNNPPETIDSSGDEVTAEAQTIAVAQLRAYIERIERLEEEKKTIGDDIKEVYAELKGSGFDSKIVRTIVRLRKKEDHVRREEEAMLQHYMDALGMS